MPKGEGLSRYNLKRAQEIAPAVYAALRDMVLLTGATRDASIDEAHNYFVSSVAQAAQLRAMDVGLAVAKVPRAGVEQQRAGRGAVLLVHPHAFLRSFDHEVAASSSTQTNAFRAPVARIEPLPANEPLPEWAGAEPLPLFKPRVIDVSEAPAAGTEPKRSSAWSIFNPFGL